MIVPASEKPAVLVPEADDPPASFARDQAGDRAGAGAHAARRFRFLDLLTIGFIVVLLISNLVGPKICQIGPLKVAGAQLLFPITYICGDIFTEVYGYAACRRAIWLGFFAMGLLSVMGAIAVALPPAPDWPNQQAFATVFAVVPRFAVASLVAYTVGEFVNAYTLARLKLLTGGRWLWTRTLGSTIVGQGVDTVLLVLIAFWGLPARALAIIIVSMYLVKVAYETIATPLTYVVVGWLKHVEQVDAFDRATDFNPFAGIARGQTPAS
ncbi:MAG TPA: queuosine precursor transporter [Acidobacteriaceae bacterium]